MKKLPLLLCQLGQSAVVWLLTWSIAITLASCARPPKVQTVVDAARAVCCLRHITAGSTPELAERACESLDAVRPFLEPTKQAADAPVLVRPPDDDGGLSREQ